NLGMQAQWFPAIYQAMGAEQAEITGGRVGFRCTTPDYLPVVGAIVDYGRFIERYAPLRKNRKYRFQKTPDYLEGLYINAGHGSRGMISCPLSGELLADEITGQTEAPIPAPLMNAIHPSRFLVRDLVRNKI
ncbi:MAG: FAD-dependent oxidoreductase, partial [Endozoicomonas sp.]